MNKQIRRMLFAAMCLALGMVMPFLTGQIPEIGGRLCPMHIPVLLCGFLCGWPYGLAVGLITPILRSLIFGAPPLFPSATIMIFELGAYGFFAGILYRVFPKKAGFVYVTLIAAMLLGRLVWGLAAKPIYAIAGMELSFQMFIAKGFVDALPGIILQIVILPPLVLALRASGLMKE